ncbi:mitochondrial carrier domain-containing protein [Gorgonomyces haynaldii]|nr:mitochondrial carrier domain-containing protein [Gorgonomyces haynaldii]
MTTLEKMASATLGSVLTSLLMTPFDVIKTRMQSGDIPNSTTLQGTKYILSKNGISGLYKGLGTTLVMSLPASVIYYVGYEYLRDQMQPLTPYAPLLSGSLARTITVTLVSPLELFRTRIQASEHGFHDTLAGIRSLLKERGLRVLWKGLSPSLWRDVPFSAIYWTLYEHIKPYACFDSLFLNAFLNGCVSGTTAALLTHPFDVTKTLQQTRTASVGMIPLMQTVYKEQGFRGLFVGLGPRLAKVAPACGIMISSYELGKYCFRLQ